MAHTGDNKITRWIRIRVLIAAGVFGALFAFLVYRAFALQVLEGERMRKLARKQYRRKVSLAGARGRIVDRHGSALAVSVEVPSVYGNPKKLRGREKQTARALAKVLDHDPYLLEERFRSDRYFVWIKRKISPAQAEAVRKLNIKGVYLKREMRRFYPNGKLAGHVLGFAGLEGNGLEGVELHFERWLKPSRSSTVGLRDALGRAIYVDGLPDLGPSTGNEVVLTLDKNIQFEADRALSDAVHEHQAKGGALVVMDPKTGQILAMSSAPRFDPNNHTIATPDSWRNRAVTDAFEPGSVTKVFTLAAALETRVVRPHDNIYCEDGRIEVDDYTIRDSHPHKWLDVIECIQKSSNICTFKLAQRLGKRRLYTYLRQFGFGSQSGVELPGERRGQLRHWRRWSRVALANISFGQGFTATAVQVAAAVAALANGGTLYVPHIVRSIRDADGRVVALYRPRGRRAISRWVSRKVVEIMKTVVKPGGTGLLAALEDYEVAGKTGTAQKVDPETGRYSKEHWVASFVGVVPADDPALAVVVLIDEPQEKYYGGEVAAPVFKRVAASALKILGVPRAAATKRRRARKKRTGRKHGLGKGRSVAPPLPVALPQGPVRQMPDFTGMGLHEVLETARKAGLKCHIEGSGIAVNQSPPPGPAPKNAPCQIGLQPR